MDSEEYRLLERQAHAARLSLGEWVRRQLSQSQRDVSRRPAEKKLLAIERARKYSFPSGPIETMLAEIERGYRVSGVDDSD